MWEELFNYFEYFVGMPDSMTNMFLQFITTSICIIVALFPFWLTLNLVRGLIVRAWR